MEQVSLKELRMQRRVSQAQLATALGISQAGLSKIESRPDVTVSMLRSIVQALGGTAQIRAKFSDDEFELSLSSEGETFERLKALLNSRCHLKPMPVERANDEFIVNAVDKSFVSLVKRSSKQLLQIPIRRVIEVVPKASPSGLPRIVLRGSLQWSAHKKFWALVESSSRK